MRIAFVDHKLDIASGGGSNLKMHTLASSLVDLGHSASIITVSSSLNTYQPDLPYTVIEEHVSDGYLSVYQRPLVVRILRKFEDMFDVFQIEAPSLIPAGALYRLLGGNTPVLATLNNYTFFCSNVSVMNSTCYLKCSLLDRLRHRREAKTKKALYSPVRVFEQFANRAVVNKVDRFLAVSAEMAEVHSKYGLDPAKMRIVPSIVDLSEVLRSSHGGEDGQAQARKGTKELRILYVGRLAREKGVDLLLRAVSDLDFPYTLSIVGEGPERERLERMSRDLGLGPAVEFEGWVPKERIGQSYRRADVMVHPGRWPEPYGRTIVEAMTLGVPLIVSDLGAPPWIAGAACLTFAPEDRVDLAGKISHLYRNPQLADQMAQAGTERVSRFSSKEVVPQMVALYEEVLGG